MNASEESSRVWLITGASSGLGRALAELALERGQRVLATAREPGRVAELDDRYPRQAVTARLDVTDAPRKVAAAIIEAVESSDPPLRLALGEEAVHAIREKLDGHRRDLEDWERLSVTTAA